MDRGRFVLDELTSALEYLFTDDVEDENDVRLATLATEHAESFSQDAVAQALNDYAMLAEQSRDGLQKLGAFDMAPHRGSARSREQDPRAVGPGARRADRRRADLRSQEPPHEPAARPDEPRAHRRALGLPGFTRRSCAR
jgi:hypothetical protein